jgi:hypothetical protein
VEGIDLRQRVVERLEGLDPLRNGGNRIAVLRLRPVGDLGQVVEKISILPEGVLNGLPCSICSRKATSGCVELELVDAACFLKSSQLIFTPWCACTFLPPGGRIGLVDRVGLSK